MLIQIFLRTLRKTRYSLLLILISLFATWLFTSLSSYFLETWMALVSMVSSFTLSTFILSLRGLFDYQVKMSLSIVNNE